MFISKDLTPDAQSNRDGHVDVGVANAKVRTLAVLLGRANAGPIAAPGSPFGLPASPLAVALGDFNGDGEPDLAVVDKASAATLLLGAGGGTFQK